MRMNLNMQHNFRDALANMGMTDVFQGDKADLGGISDERGLHLGLVAQQVFTRVYEEGTEAAAVTYGTAFGGEMPKPKPTVRFVTDRPFLFVIRHEPTGVILFMGRMANPRSE